MVVERFWNGMRVAKVKGKPYDMGKQRGEQLTDIIRDNLNRVLSSKKENFPIEKILEEAGRFEDGINKKFPEIIEELRGIADGAKVPWENLSAATLGTIPTKESFAKHAKKYNIPKFAEDCSCFAATGQATSDGMPIMAKNADGTYRHKILLIAEPSDGNKYAGGGLPLWPGIDDGMSEKGIALSGSGSFPKDSYEAYAKGKPLGVPIIYLHGFMFTHSDDFDSMLEYIKISPRGYYGRNVNIIDDEGNIVKAEVSYEHVNFVYPPEQFVASANHFVSTAMNKYGPSPEEYPSSYKRYERFMELLPPAVGKINFDFAQKVMKDHKYGHGNYSICRHGPRYSWASFILQPVDKRLWALLGHPCETEYEPLSLGK